MSQSAVTFVNMEIKLNPLRREILSAAEAGAGVPEDRWTYNRPGEIALRYLVKQKCLDRRIGDSAKAFQCRLFITDRGRKLLAGDIIEEIVETPKAKIATA